ncbi:accessory gene regulator ArgB-like protein [Paenibacillus sp. sgz500958]|uniref:accessory gene regulator ArgB-like protein n=1 Tax=Paenibacillus sp. sgz500958 TaxID=3242475 RepID=UPI0036D32CD3
MIERLAANSAAAIKRRVPHHPASAAVMQYALEVIYNALFIVTFSLLISLFTGKSQEVVAILVAFAVLRQITGGIHLKSSVSCVAASTIGCTLLSIVQLQSGILYLIGGLSLGLVLIFAPSRLDEQTRIPVRFYPVLKIIGAVVVIISVFIQWTPVSVSVFVQAMTLIKFTPKGGDHNE